MDELSMLWMPAPEWRPRIREKVAELSSLVVQILSCRIEQRPFDQLTRLVSVLNAISDAPMVTDVEQSDLGAIAEALTVLRNERDVWAAAAPALFSLVERHTRGSERTTPQHEFLHVLLSDRNGIVNLVPGVQYVSGPVAGEILRYCSDIAKSGLREQAILDLTKIQSICDHGLNALAVAFSECEKHRLRVIAVGGADIEYRLQEALPNSPLVVRACAAANELFEIRQEILQEFSNKSRGGELES